MALVRFIGVTYGDISSSVDRGDPGGGGPRRLRRGDAVPGGLRGRDARGRARGKAQRRCGAAVAFGLFHLPNIFMGTGPGALLQVFLAAGSGLALYAFRRFSTFIWVAVGAHGLWDISAFMDGVASGGVAHGIATGGSFLVSGLGLVSIFVLLEAGQAHRDDPRANRGGAERVRGADRRLNVMACSSA